MSIVEGTFTLSFAGLARTRLVHTVKGRTGQHSERRVGGLLPSTLPPTVVHACEFPSILMCRCPQSQFLMSAHSMVTHRFKMQLSCQQRCTPPIRFLVAPHISAHCLYHPLFSSCLVQRQWHFALHNRPCMKIGAITFRIVPLTAIRMPGADRIRA